MEVFEAADKVAYMRTDQTRPDQRRAKRSRADLAGARMRAGAAADADLLYTKLLPETLTETETGKRKDEPNRQTDRRTDKKTQRGGRTEWWIWN